MIDSPHTENQIHCVNSFNDLVSTSFYDKINVVEWTRKLVGDFSEIVNKIELDGEMMVLDLEQLQGLQLSKQGQLAREILIKDLALFKAHGASPILNVIKTYERDDSYPFFPTDVYSFHVDRSPIPIDTFLCTYHGTSSEVIPNTQAKQKILIPEIRDELKKLYHGKDDGFDSFLSEYFFDLHYQANLDAKAIALETGHIWKLAVDHPESKVLQCIHRAPKEKDGQKRLLLIC